MRSWLRDTGFSGAWVDAWMGHLNAGDDCFSRYSGLSQNNLRQMAEAINNYLVTTLGVTVAPHWSQK